MNKKIALSAMVMFAVTLGLGVFGPAMADKPGDDPHKVPLCHFTDAKNEFNMTGDGLWHNSTAGMNLIEVDSQGQMNGHFDKKTAEPRHGNGTLVDFVINGTAGFTEDDCLALAPVILSPLP